MRNFLTKLFSFPHHSPTPLPINNEHCPWYDLYKFFFLLVFIMCTLGTVDRHFRSIIDRYIGRYSAEYRSTIDRYIGRYSVVYQSTIDRYIGRYSVEYAHRPILFLFVDSRPRLYRYPSDTLRIVPK